MQTVTHSAAPLNQKPHSEFIVFLKVENALKILMELFASEKSCAEF